MTVVRAPASSANLGPGFDCAAVALDLWNELEISDGEGVEVEGEGSGELPTDGTSLVVRAYALLDDPAGKCFRCMNRIPLERGLGSSAAAIALGLAAGAEATGERDVERLLALALQLEPHADNLAATLLGGVTLTDGRRAWRVADSLPLTPVVVVPERRVATGESRAALPASLSHADATHTAVHAALLGAGLALRDPELVAAALDDRLHEPYRPSEVLDSLREPLPAGAVGATLSGSGPSVLVWAEQPDEAAAELRDRFPGHRVLELAVADRGAL